ncbi:FAD:protein FMN transferase [Floccifex sp.]|uniref:FAD:protein FMN transferase n=1 Tax=Floccifex sp. TaxID=2815810 RepID=UPI003EFE6512
MKKNIQSWFLFSICFLILIASILFYLSNQKPKETTQSITLTNVGFDTAITFSCTTTKTEFDSYVSLIQEAYTYYNQLFDQYHSNDINNVYTLNQKAKNEYIQVDEELIDCIQIAKKVYEINSKFDITSGSLLSIWHTKRLEGISLNEQGKDGFLPDENEIHEAKKHIGFNLLDIQGNTIHYLDPQLQLDLGGIAKGYASQKVKEKLNEAGCDNGFINAGGNVVLLGKKDWHIGIQDPDSNESLLDYQTNEDVCIVTSGDYQRYYTIDNQKYSHIIDPDTGYPANLHRSVTVICKDSAIADAYSTLLFCLSVEDGIKLLEDTDIQAIWITNQECSIEKTLQNENYNIYCTPDTKISFTTS